MADEVRGKRTRAVIYCRTSSDDKDLIREEAHKTGEEREKVSRRESIEEQKKMCIARCERLGFELIAEPFEDRDISGRTYPKGYSIRDPAFDIYYSAHINRLSKKERIGLGNLLNLPNIDIIIVRDIYRILRPAFQSHLGNHIWQELTRRKIKIHSIYDGEIDSSKFEDLMLTNLKLQLADQAKQQEVEASIKSLRGKKDRGLLATGVKCLGFRTRKGTKEQEVDSIPEELDLVRLIYDKYLGGKKLMEIAKSLNDDEKRHPLWIAKKADDKSSKPRLWTVQLVRKVLLRPWYCGLSYNSAGELIPSRVFPTGEDAAVTVDEYYRVKESFEKRERYKMPIDRNANPRTTPVKRKRNTGEKHHYEKRICHPFTGLVKCGVCGKHLYVSRVVNPYYDDKIPVATYYYMCKTPQVTKSHDYDECKRVRIKEEYPGKSLELGVKPGGNGLIEALFPLLFHGCIALHVQKTSTTKPLYEQRSQLQFQLTKVEEHEMRIFQQQEQGVIDDEQFKVGMKRNRDRKAELRGQLNRVQAEIATLESPDVAIPNELFLDPKSVSRETMQDLAHNTFEEILVYGDRVKVVLKRINPETSKPYSFTIERIQARNARNLPFWKAMINAPTLTPATKIGVAYYYKSTRAGLYRNVHLLYRDEHLEVNAFGDNTSVDKKRNKELPNPNDLDAWLETKYGPTPAYQRQLEVNSNAFFGPLMMPAGQPKE